MQSKIHKVGVIFFVLFFLLLFANCTLKGDMDNQITIKINSIDEKSKKRRINMFDTVEVRKEGFGWLMKTFNVVGVYKTDSTGSVKIKIDSTKISEIHILGLHEFGIDMYYPGHLKNNQEVDIEVRSYKEYWK